MDMSEFESNESKKLQPINSSNIQRSLNYITFLKKEGDENAYITKLKSIIVSLKKIASKDQIESAVQESIVKHLVEYTGKLIVNKNFEEGFSVLDMVRDWMPESSQKEHIVENLNASFYNNLAACLTGSKDTNTAIKALQKSFKTFPNPDAKVTCILYNNLSALYLTKGDAERAFKCSRKVINLIQTEVFELIKSDTGVNLKNNSKFKKALFIILISYLNMGTSVERFNASNSKDSRIVRDISEIVSKDLYLHGFSIAVKFLGGGHTLSQRFLHRYIKAQAADDLKADHASLNYFERLAEIRSTSKKPGYSSKGSVENSPELLDKGMNSSQIFYKFELDSIEDSSAKQQFKIRGTSLTRDIKSKPTLEVDFSRTSLDDNNNLEDSKALHEMSFSGLADNRSKYVRSSRKYKTMNPQGSQRPDPLGLFEQSESRLALERTASTNYNSQMDGYRPMITSPQRKTEDKSLSNTERSSSPVLLKAFSLDSNNGDSILIQQGEPTLKDLHKEIKDLKDIFQQFEAVLPGRDKKANNLTENPVLQRKGSGNCTDDKYGSFNEIPAINVTPPILSASSTNMNSSSHQADQQCATPSPRFNIKPKQLPLEQQGTLSMLNSVGKRSYRRSSITITNSSGNEPENEKNVRPEAISQRRNSLIMVLPIPTNIETLDSPALKSGNSGSNDNQVSLKHAVISKKVFLSDTEEYKIVCKGMWTKDVKKFSLELSKKDAQEDSFTILHQRELQYKNLQTILKQLHYKDVLPLNSQVKNIRSFYNLIKQLLIPFTHIKMQDGKKEITITPRPPSLLTFNQHAAPTITFTEKECMVLLVHVQNNLFRMTLINVENDESFRIDIEMDESSISKYFEKHKGKKADLRKISTASKIIDGYDDNAGEEEMIEARDTIKKLSDPGRKDEEELDVYKLINPDILAHLSDYIIEIEEFLAKQGVKTFKELSDEKTAKYFKIKITQNLKKACLFVVWDKLERGVFDIVLKNFYETYDADGKAKAVGTATCAYDIIWKYFGVDYDKLEFSDKVSMCSLVSDMYYLDTSDKPLTEEDLDRFDPNPIIFMPVEVGTFKRSFLGNGLKFPLTLSLVGINSIPKGVKATIYNRNEAKEVGAFFHVDPEYWAKELTAKKKKGTKLTPLEINENYELKDVLNNGGWKILEDALVLDTNMLKMQIVGIKIVKGISLTEQIENILNPESLCEMCKNRNDD